MQKCGQIEKFDMIFHKSGPQAGQARGYAFVTFHDVSEIFSHFLNVSTKKIKFLNGNWFFLNRALVQ